MENATFLGALSLFTLVAVVAFGVYHLMKVRRSQLKRGEHPGGIAGPD